MHITLTVIAGPHTGKVFTFDGQESFVVGRAKRVLFQLPKKDRFISRHHFVVEVNPPHFRLMDLQSRNGTFVNDERVKSADLKHEDIIRLGHTVMQVHLEVGGDAALEESKLMDTVRQAPPAPDEPELEPIPEEPVRIVFPSLPPAVTAADFKVETIKPSDPAEEEPAPDSPQLPATPAAPVSSPPAFAVDSGLPSCPLCGQSWAPGEDRTAPWCELCNKAMKRLAQICPGYRLVRELGRGNTGAIYQAVHEADHSLVVVRHLTPEEKMRPVRRQRFQDEIEKLKGFRHPGVAALLACVEADEQLFLVSEYARGETAWHVLKQAGSFAPTRAVVLLDQCLAVLELAHEQGVMHREIRPSCIMLHRARGREQARLLDFGLGWLCQMAHVSRYSLLKGQAEAMTWISPELIYDLKNVTASSDLYSLAATFYTLLSGRPLFPDDGVMADILRRVLEDDPEPLERLCPDLPSWLGALFERALAKDPSDRFATAAEFRQQLQPYLDEQES